MKPLLRDPVKEILSCLGKCTAGGQDNYRVFDDWLDIVHATLKAIPSHVKSVNSGAELTDTPETEALFARMRERYPHDYYWQNFTNAFSALVESTDEYRDVIGKVYMDFNISNKHTGQFFTPWAVAEAMAEMSMNDIETTIHERMKEAIKGDPVAEALLICSTILTDEDDAFAFFVEKLLPAAAPRFVPITICDPCCGSGIMLLAAASQCPTWAIQWGLVRFYGQDIDETCVKMAEVNMMLYGLNSYHMKCALGLTEDELEAIPEPYSTIYREAQAVANEPEKIEEIKEKVAKITAEARQLKLFEQSNV